ncbi:MAG: hypothetical protein IT318_14740 [Anaerolineales bacterium]|nr:hypothetical protein [Anaerolineales bacterium]
MQRTELAALLNAGIAAVQAGDLAHGRELLLRVVEADERVEPAWLWLSAALEQPADQLLALENVLALNPNNTRARFGVLALRRRLGLPETPALAAPGPPSATPASTARPSTPEAAQPPLRSAALAVDPAQHSEPGAEDDPDQCVYCGRAVAPEANRCPHCGRALLTSGAWRAGGYQYLLLIMVGLQLQGGLLQGIVAYLWDNYPSSLDFLPWEALLAHNPLLPAVVRMFGWAVVLMMLLWDSLAAYRWAAVLALVDLAWAGAGWGISWLAREIAAVNAVLAGGIVLVGFSAVISQAQARRRLHVAVDRGIHSGLMLHQRAERYARRGMWALAAVHWQRAIARQPREPLYYKALGKAQARLGRRGAALRSFQSGAEVAPGDGDFARLIVAVKADDHER